MKFASSYEPNQYEPDIYAAWEAAGVFKPTIPATPVDDDINGQDDRKVWSESTAKSIVTDYNATDPKNHPKYNAYDYTYSIVMPPPNANGNLHIGHGLTIAIEDSLTRYYRLNGKSAWYIPGADHAGFETWVVYERNLEASGHTRFEFDRDALYARVWDFVAEQRGNMELQLRALGASCSWDDLTFTLDENVIDRVYTTFEKMWNDGLIYRGEKLVNFCPKHRTAFADIEVEHKDEPGTLWDIEYKLEDDSVDQAISLTVSTTRPETLFGDTAVAVNPNDDRYKSLIGKHVKLPLADRIIPIIADEHADPEYGTGVVKITPAHDFDDFEVGGRHDLERIRVIAEDGTMINVPEKYLGLTTADCRKLVLKDLKELGQLKDEHHIVHSVAHCYKCGTVLEPTLKSQWFVDVEKLAKMAIEHLENNEIKFHPANKKKVIINYLKGLKDWNISRQIPWGIAIPMFHQVGVEGADGLSEQTGYIGNRNSFSEDRKLGRTPLSVSQKTGDTGNRDSFSEDRKLGRAPLSVSEEKESDYQKPLTTEAHTANDAPEWIFDRRTNLKEIEKSGIKYVRDEDTFDTWFSSSHWPIICTDWTEGNLNPYYPLNVMETAADILFAWVARMIMMGLYVTGEVPFREVYLHGLVLDEHGQKMSKSKGNVINPLDLVTKYGSDAFRLGILRGRSAGMNQAFSENSVISGRNLCNKLWNISRLIQSFVDESVNESEESISQHLRDTDSQNHNGHGRGAGTEIPGRVRLSRCDFDDRGSSTLRNLSSDYYNTDNIGEDWICREINDCLEQVESDMESYRFSEAVETLYSTIWEKYADWFLESQKIYKNIPLLKITLETLLIALHPFAPFVTEAIWQNLSWTEGFIATAKWPARLQYDPISAEKFESLRNIVQTVRGTLQALPGTNNSKKYDLLYDNDSLVEDNLLLIKALTKVPAISALNGAPRGLKLALANHELYLDVPEKVVKDYRDSLSEKILSVGRELDALNLRMSNPNYVAKAPEHLVKETKDQIKEKEQLIARLKTQLELI